MNTQNFILTYVQSCASGKLGLSECGPIWQMGVIVVFLLVAVLALVAMRFRPRSQPQ